MVLAGQREQRHQHQQHDRQRCQHRVPGKGCFATPDGSPAAAAQRHDTGQRQPAKRHQRDAAECRHADVVGQRRRIVQMRAAELQPRKLAHRALPRPVDGFLGVEVRCERRRIGLFIFRTQRPDQRVEHRQHLDCVLRLVARLAVERNAVMQRIEQADAEEGQQHRRRRHAGAAGANAAPGGQQRRASGDQHADANATGQQQPDQHIGPQDDDLETHHEKRIRGSTRV